MNKEDAYLNYDPQSDVLYIAAEEGQEEEFIEIVPGVNVELDARGQVIGIEILRASRFLKPVARSLLQHMEAG